MKFGMVHCKNYCVKADINREGGGLFLFIILLEVFNISLGILKKHHAHKDPINLSYIATRCLFVCMYACGLSPPERLDRFG